MEKIKLYSYGTEIGEVDNETFEIVKMCLKKGEKIIDVVRSLISKDIGTALAVRIALNAKKSNNRSD